jgi:peptidoglycan/LPS O-acetylase OafA/YrhL
MEKLTYRKDIDGLRGLAILLVIFYHAFPRYFSVGYVGVDIFFVISGYLITGILQSDPSQSLLHFYQRRVRRIFPALIVFLGVFWFLGYVLLFQNEYAELSKHVLASSLFMNNILLWHDIGYFDAIRDFKPLLHLWSLAVEEQFYLIWPPFLYLLYRNKITLSLGISCMIFISLGLNYLYPQQFYLPFSRIWELALGGLIFVYRLPSLSKFQQQTIKSIAASMLLVAIVFKHQLLMLIMLNVFISSLIVYPGTLNRYVLSQALLVGFGLISYPLYLWHWGFLSFARIIHSGAISLTLTCLILILSIVMSIMTYRLIEKPIRKNMQSVKPLLLLMLMVASLGALGVWQNGLPKRLINTQRQTYLQDLNTFDSYKTNAVSCQVDGIDICLQSHAGHANGLIWGDSHAEQLLAGLIGEDHAHQWLLLANHACPPLLGVRAYWKGQQDICLQANEKILSIIAGQPNIKTVVLSSVGLFYLSNEMVSEQLVGPYSPGNFYLQMDAFPMLNKPAVFAKGFANTVRQLLDLGKQVIVVEDSPLLPFMPIACLSRPLLKQPAFCQLSFEKVLQVQTQYRELLNELVHQYPNISVFRSVDVLCHDGRCPVIENQHYIYRDSQHLSLYGSRLLAHGFIQQFQNKSV